MKPTDFGETTQTIKRLKTDVAVRIQYNTILQNDSGTEKKNVVSIILIEKIK